MENSEKKAEETKNPADFFKTDRGERDLYQTAGLTEEVILPLTRDGFEAILERASGMFQPAIPLDDSTRKVFAGYVHNIKNESNTTTIETIGKVLYKSISNALTWTIDQEIKMRQQTELQEMRAKAQAEADAKAKAEAIEKRELKQSKKAGRRMTVKQKPNESEMS